MTDKEISCGVYEPQRKELRVYREPTYWVSLAGLASAAPQILAKLDPGRVHERLQGQEKNARLWLLVDDVSDIPAGSLRLVIRNDGTSFDHGSVYKWNYEVSVPKGPLLERDNSRTTDKPEIVFSKEEVIDWWSRLCQQGKITSRDHSPKLALKISCTVQGPGSDNNCRILTTTISVAFDDRYSCEEAADEVFAFAKDLTYLYSKVSRRTYGELAEREDPTSRVELESGDVILRTGGELSDALRQLITPWSDIIHSGILECVDGTRYVHYVVGTGYQCIPLAPSDLERAKESSPTRPPKEKLKVVETFLEGALKGTIRVYRFRGTVGVYVPSRTGRGGEAYDPITFGGGREKFASNAAQIGAFHAYAQKVSKGSSEGFLLRSY